MPQVFYQVRKKIGDMRDTLPAGVQGPFFNDEFGDVFGNMYALTAEGFDYPQLKDQAERIRDELLRIPNVGKVEIFGIQDEKIFIELSNTKLATLGIDQAAIVQALAQQNAVVGSGFFETERERIHIRPGGAFDSVQAVANTLIRAGNRAFRLGDIATVRRGTIDPPGHPGPFWRQAGAGHRCLDDPGWRHHPARQGSGPAYRQPASRAAGRRRHPCRQPASRRPFKRSIQAFVQALAEAVLVVLLVTFVSLGIRTGMVVALSIPLVLAATFLGMSLLNVGLHKVSLGALILALGLLVNDAIIAVEMMWGENEAKLGAHPRRVPCLHQHGRADAVRYAGHPWPGFIPIALAKSATGEYAFAFFQINAVALLISWLAAVIAIPWLGYKLLPIRWQSAHPAPWPGKRRASPG